MEELENIQDILLRLKSPLPICRICLHVSMEYIQFDSPLCVINGKEITYSDAFHEISSFIYELPEKLSTNLCSVCGNDLLNTYLFLKRVESTNYILEMFKTLELNLSETELKLPNTETGKFVKSLKVEIINGPNSGNDLGLWSSAKLDNDPDSTNVCHRGSEVTKQMSLAYETSNDICLDKKSDSDLNPIRDDSLLQKYADEEKWFKADEISQICESEKLFAEHPKTNDSEVNYSKFGQKCLLENELPERPKGNDNNYSCTFCRQYFRTKAMLTIHANTHKDRLRYKKYMALRKKIQKSRQWRNSKRVDEKKGKCQNSKEILRPQNRLKNSHVVQQSETNGFICNICGKTFLTAIGLKSHSRVHKEKEFVCHICNKLCSTESTLKRHIDHIHLSDCKKYQCEDCGLVFKYPSYLKDHQRKHDAKEKYKCPFCDRSYCRKPQFDIHLRYHYNDYRYKCNHCNKGYATKSNLTDHIKSTHIKVTYDCDKCDHKFKSATGLKKHRYSHTGYPYSCPLCLLGQASRSGIKSHLFGVHRGAVTMDEFNKMFPLMHPKSGYRRPKIKSIE